MRILLDECSYEWDAAFDICRKVFAYTNHTVMSEALEKWNVDIFRSTLPRIWQIVQEMDRRCRADLEKAFPGDQGKINYMAIIGDNQSAWPTSAPTPAILSTAFPSCTARSSRQRVP